MIACLSEIFGAGKFITMQFEPKVWEADPGLCLYKSWRLSY